ncbi:MAG: helix-turn-helix transcriptional regulator [Flexistipes sinusarabici]|uniref:Helix-turn-helix transcriptional regulator n=1 Tax=Flexistipes sinusarabici TaxID=2352 RepID=A0A5D0MI87_FLESI|nr:metalloregulator ArsR/SmtB family transcription factor [Flexistipes sinusarabici]TYB33434.1 MAG: helix-turn-helix transcriptional regulator [Flexistipes sinusarabici]
MIKEEKFSGDEIQLATIAKALAHPARIQIIKFLAESGECMCGRIVDVLPLSQATVSQHLSTLKNAGLIKGNIEGQRVCYCIDEKAFKLFENEISAFLKKITINNTCQNGGIKCQTS